MKKLLTAGLVGLTIGLSGCVISVDGDGNYSHQSDWEKQERKNRQLIAQLMPNQDFQVVKNRLGTADFNEFFEKDGNTYRVLFYRTHRTEGDGVTTKDECTPLVFKNDLLVGWGDSAYQFLER
ncbi:DUF3192 domain-containing protein [Paraglaciecola aestuariivivens]